MAYSMENHHVKQETYTPYFRIIESVDRFTIAICFYIVSTASTPVSSFFTYNCVADIGNDRNNCC